MKIRMLALVLALSAPVAVFAGDKDGEKKAGDKKMGDKAAAAAGHEMGDASMDEMMAQWEAMATPGEHHKYLTYFVGSWTTQDKHWMGAPDAKETTGKATYESMMDGRYVKSSYTSEMMGKTFTGVGFTGYDNAKNQYWNAWMDNFSTGCMMATGHALEGGKGHEMSTTMNDPTMGGDVPIRMVTKIVDKNTFVLEMYMTPPGGEEMKSMEITHTRVAS
jgi:hypothetical protein